MKTFLPNDYPNLLDDVRLTYQEIENQIRSYGLQFLQVRNQAVEWGMAFPMFLPCFYKYLLENNRILSQTEFWTYYQTCNSDFFTDRALNQTTMEGLKARVFRTYPSIVRDIYFATYVKNHLAGNTVIYNQKLDIEEGIDLLIIWNQKYFGINLYTDTTRAYQGREKKVHRHIKFDNVQYVELPVDFKGSVKCGDFFLYGDKEYQQIKNVLTQK